MKKKKDNIDIDTIYEIEDSNNEIDKIIGKDSYNRLISKLDDTEKQIISLKIVANLSFDEISGLLNIPTGTVKWKYYKSINTLKILLSNLSMFVVTFLSGMWVFKNGEKLSNATDSGENQEIGNINKDEEIEGNPPKEDKNELFEEETDKQENIIVEDPVINDSPNHIGIGLMSVSFIFLIITITFSIIFTKHQLNRRKKLSK